MGAPKRKRQSTDSAITDMSSKGSFASDPTTQASTQQPKRHRTAQSTAEFRFDVRDFGTAASQRSRRTAPHSPLQPVIPPNTLRSLEESKSVVVEMCHDVPSSSSGQGSEDDPPHSPNQEVKGNSRQREQTPEQSQAAAGLPSPPQTINRSNSQLSSQTPLRKSTRERRPTVRIQEAIPKEVTPTKKISKGGPVHIEAATNVSRTTIQKRRIVRLRIKTSAAQKLSMSFTGSFSHRQKSDDPPESLVSQQVGPQPLLISATLTYYDRTIASLWIAVLTNKNQRHLRSRGQNRFSQIVRTHTLHSLMPTVRWSQYHCLNYKSI